VLLLLLPEVMTLPLTLTAMQRRYRHSTAYLD
jgi:hypothetical protein